MRSMAQNRLTAVGRVAASVSQTRANWASSSHAVGLRHAERHAHGRGHADGRRAANHHAPDGIRHLFVGAAGDVGLLERQTRLVDHDDPLRGPLDGFEHVGR